MMMMMRTSVIHDDKYWLTDTEHADRLDVLAERSIDFDLADRLRNLAYLKRQQCDGTKKPPF
jgi:hypothetical protein